jgi:nucleoside-diphosphate-sugar epimerase
MRASRTLVLGCGYVGLRLVRSLTEAGCETTATSAREDRFADIAATGASPVRADALEPSTLRALAEQPWDVVFDLVRPQQIAPGRYTSWGTRNISALFADHPPAAMVYLSSTSVYQSRGSGWIDETTQAHPTTAFGEARAEAESIYLDLFRTRGLPVRICRAPSVYGPNRNLRERLEGGAYTRVDDDEQCVSHIHVDDLATGLIAAWQRGGPGEIYLLCDDEPVTGREYAELTADLLALPVPPPLPRADIRQERGAEVYERRSAIGRCSNRRMREELGVILRYPSVREGIPACLREEGAI